MLEVISTTSIAFIVIALGYVSVKRSVFSPLDMEILGKYVINFALPALIFQAVSGRDFREILNIGYLSAYLGGSLLIFAGGYVWSRRVSGLTPMASIFQSMGMSCSNSGYVGYPILLVAMPAIASTALALNMIVENQSEPECFQKADVKTQVPIAVGEGLVHRLSARSPRPSSSGAWRLISRTLRRTRKMS